MIKRSRSGVTITLLQQMWGKLLSYFPLYLFSQVPGDNGHDSRH